MDVKDIQDLRKKTGAGIMDAKNALKEAGGDADRAVEILRARGASVANKKSEREASEGRVFSYTHSGDKIGVLLTILCETDFVARTEEFQRLGRGISLHLAAMNPLYLSRSDVSESDIEKEKAIYRQQARNENKPKEVIEKIVEGKIQKFYAENVLLEQSFVKDSDKTIKQIIEEEVARLGENIYIGKFVRYEI